MCQIWVIHWFNFAVVAVIVFEGKADIYLHNPRGSNNRLNEATQPRKNSNRLFDSQNNNRGGYNAGTMKYYAGSTLNIEWTNQHSCNSLNTNCEIILQYMCDDLLRDGTTSQTIPYLSNKCSNNKCDTDFKYGMHENYSYNQHCRSRAKNNGLFTADQKLKGQSALFTRQNPQGKIYGFECPEEKDYYPYWYPTPWKDIAILTNNVSRCNFYREESENIKSRGWCYLPEDILSDLIKQKLVIPITQEECETFSYPPNDPSINGVWKHSFPHGIPPPECRETEYTRDNHLGDTIGGSSPSYQWTIPDLTNTKCVLRIRYNISSGDIDGWNSNVNSSINEDLLMQKFSSNVDVMIDRGYVLKNNPRVKIFPGVDLALNLAIDTSQYGRVFQDRSHVFTIMSPPAGVSGSQAIHNLNVRGKRGNIVEVYPAVEYDFVPSNLELAVNDFVHIQWTGSNSNPLGNEGNGKLGTDRSNIVPLANSSDNLASENSVSGDSGYNYPLFSLQNVTSLGFSVEDFYHLAFLDGSGDVSLLDDQGAYFNAPLKQITRPGTFNYFCTRNNDFSKRQQKGRIVATSAQLFQKSIGWNGGNFTIGANRITINEGVIDGLKKIRIEKWNIHNIAQSPMLQTYQEFLTENLISDVIVIYPEGSITSPNGSFQIRMHIHSILAEIITVYRSTTSDLHVWQRVNTEIIDRNVAVIEATRGGVYLIRSQANTVAIMVIVVIAVIALLLLFGAVLYFHQNQQKWRSLLHVLKIQKTPQMDNTS